MTALEFTSASNWVGRSTELPQDELEVLAGAVDKVCLEICALAKGSEPKTLNVKSTQILRSNPTYVQLVEGCVLLIWASPRMVHRDALRRLVGRPFGSAGGITLTAVHDAFLVTLKPEAGYGPNEGYHFMHPGGKLVLATEPRLGYWEESSLPRVTEDDLALGRFPEPPSISELSGPIVARELTPAERLRLRRAIFGIRTRRVGGEIVQLVADIKQLLPEAVYKVAVVNEAGEITRVTEVPDEAFLSRALLVGFQEVNVQVDLNTTRIAAIDNGVTDSRIAQAQRGAEMTAWRRYFTLNMLLGGIAVIFTIILAVFCATAYPGKPPSSYSEPVPQEPPRPWSGYFQSQRQCMVSYGCKTRDNGGSFCGGVFCTPNIATPVSKDGGGCETVPMKHCFAPQYFAEEHCQLASASRGSLRCDLADDSLSQNAQTEIGALVKSPACQPLWASFSHGGTGNVQGALAVCFSKALQIVKSNANLTAELERAVIEHEEATGTKTQTTPSSSTSPSLPGTMVPGPLRAKKTSVNSAAPSFNVSTDLCMEMNYESCGPSDDIAFLLPCYTFIEESRSAQEIGSCLDRAVSQRKANYTAWVVAMSKWETGHAKSMSSKSEWENSSLKFTRVYTGLGVVTGLLWVA